MLTNTDGPVLVAVESASNVGAALAFAEQEALRTDGSLLLLHVINLSAFTPSESYPWRAFQGVAQDMLAGLAGEVEERVGGRVPVRCEVAYGPVVRTIVDRSTTSRLVVLQGEDRGRLERLVTGQVRNGVAARAQAPVVCVPPAWSPGAAGEELVVAGVDDPEPDPGLVCSALARAAERGCRTRFVHAWWFTEPLDDTMFTRATAREWSLQMQDRLRRNVERVATVPDTPGLEVQVVHRRPADALVAQSRHATLLVLGRRDPRLPFGSHLGPVVRSVLRGAECPVMVVEGEPDSR